MTLEPHGGKGPPAWCIERVVRHDLVEPHREKRPPSWCTGQVVWPWWAKGCLDTLMN